MTPEVAELLLSALGTKREGVTSSWMTAKCPLAKYRHKGGVDSRPSFGLHLEEGSQRFNCFACEGGQLPYLFQMLEMHGQQNPNTFSGDLVRARDLIEALTSALPVLTEYEEFPEATKPYSPMADWVLDDFLAVDGSPRSYAYAIKRGFTLKEMYDYNLRYDIKKDMLVFPYYDAFGHVAGARGRAVELEGEKAKGYRHHDYTFGETNNSSLMFYNEPVFNLDGPVVVVEGAIDCIKVCRVWKKVVGNLTAKPVPSRTLKLGHSDGVVLLMDGDSAGRKATEKWVNALSANNIPCRPIYLPFDESTGVKSDPDTIGSEYLESEFIRIGLLDN